MKEFESSIHELFLRNKVMSKVDFKNMQCFLEITLLRTEAVAQSAPLKKWNLVQCLFFNKVTGLCNFIKRGSGTGVFLWISEISIKTFVYRTTLVTAYVRMVTLMCVKELIAQWLGPCFTNLEWPALKLIGGSMIESALFHPRYMKGVQGIPWGLVVKIKLQGEPCPWKRALSFILHT